MSNSDNDTANLSQLVREDARRVLDAQAKVALSKAQFDEFVALCGSAPVPGKRLQETAARLDAEGFALDNHSD